MSGLVAGSAINITSGGTTVADNGFVVNPASTDLPDGTNVNIGFGRQGDLMVSEVHGKHYLMNYRGAVFSANVTAVTVPVVASGLVSVFTLYNPPGSGVNAEILETTIGMVLATTVVDTVGWYFSTAALTAAGTFTTRGTALSATVGNIAANKVQFFSAYTHSGTPVRQDIIGSFGAVTNANSSLPTKFYDGRLILPPGIAMSVAMSTAAGTTSGLDIEAVWAEVGL